MLYLESVPQRLPKNILISFTIKSELLLLLLLEWVKSFAIFAYVPVSGINSEGIEQMPRTSICMGSKNWLKCGLTQHIEWTKLLWIITCYDPWLTLLCFQPFNNQEKVEASVQKFFAFKDKNWYQHGIKQLAEKWLQTVQHDDLLLWMLGCFCCNLQNKANKLTKILQKF